jgi:hypothetical protein
MIRDYETSRADEQSELFYYKFSFKRPNTKLIKSYSIYKLIVLLL